ncbi:tryptophanase leader peptide [Conservatibacter flavescens]|uniref:Tryptophanase leader peptide n=1 Tax=Conservatibacter flavescens TaxID=28161 RepID=A0A2M8S4T6_9PAST|nr:tryptophanase leader peptide [Conservatibacter flavescens]
MPNVILTPNQVWFIHDPKMAFFFPHKTSYL